ncbi:Centrosomal protein of 97 kDa [Strongyloides ratti]|uniref:Centrosomal protein of 97 kDa n=1 Tax=Strongyloides ratti TaxID=34506 RepID=A0A090L3E2_STRRB|nr:Centrosomal protein of 97 kDa [Strongyloides ratti]CEF62019.1 Centrosomal protein of 97 kDa [Strongyloides ratti]
MTSDYQLTKSRLNLVEHSNSSSLSPSQHQMNTEEPQIIEETLNLAGLGISRINLQYKDKYKSLRKLDISNNVFHAASGFKYFFDLEELNASNNCIQHLYFVQPLARSLKILNLSHNGLKQLESEIFCKMYFLEECDFSHNQISKIRLSHDLPRLKHLNLANNFINCIPLINNFSSLTTLNLAHNQLISLQDISKSFPTSLKHLDISSNIINDITEFMYLRGMELFSLKIENNPCVKTHGRSFCYRAYFSALVRSLTELDGFLLDDVDKLKGEFITMNGLFIKFKPRITSHAALCEFLTEQCPLSQVPDSVGRMSLKSVTGEKFSKIYDSFRSNSSAGTINDENIVPSNSTKKPKTKITIRDMPKSPSENEMTNNVVDASFKLQNLCLENLDLSNNLNLTHDLLDSEDDYIDSGTRSVSQSSQSESIKTVHEIPPSQECHQSTNSDLLTEQELNSSEKKTSLQYHSLESLSEESVENSKKLFQQISSKDKISNKYHINTDIDKIQINNSNVDIAVIVSDKQRNPNDDNNVMELSPREEISLKSLSTKHRLKKLTSNKKRKMYNKERYLNMMHMIKESREIFNKHIQLSNNEVKELKEANETIKLDLEENLNEYKEVINSHAVSISCLQDKINEQQKSIDNFKNIISKIYPIVLITDVRKTKNNVIEIEWANEQSITNSIKGYDVYVDNKYAGIFKGANKFISIAKLDLTVDHEIRIKCVVDGMENVPDLPFTTFKIKKNST